MTREPKFIGMVVNPNSPNDGRVLASDAQNLRLTIRSCLLLCASRSLERYHFEQVEFYRESRDKPLRWGFWVPESQTGENVMDALVQSYQRATQLGDGNVGAEE